MNEVELYLIIGFSILLFMYISYVLTIYIIINILISKINKKKTVIVPV